MARAERVVLEKNVVVPLRDGTLTKGDLYLPDVGGPVPGLVCRNLYDKEVELRAVGILPSPIKLAERGYAVLVTDVRGRFASEGGFTPFVNEGPDGYDTIEWMASQPWCDGKVGIYGPSYLGAAALLAARERPPSLKCAVPMITSDDYFNDWVYRAGTFQRGFAANWAKSLLASGASRLEPTLREQVVRDLTTGPSQTDAPLENVPGLRVPGAAPWWFDWLSHDTRDEYWEAMSPSRDYSDYQVPMLHIGGWWDLFGHGTVRNFLGMREASEADQYLMMGPWAHTHFDQYHGDVNFGPTASAAGSGAIAAFNRFVDRYLRDGQGQLPQVKYFVLGENQWHEATSWPPEQATSGALYLRSSGSAKTRHGDGELSETPPLEFEQEDRCMHDALNPVPTMEPAGPRDQRLVEERQDVLCYTSSAFESPATLVGPVEVELWATTDSVDIEWTASLVQVSPENLATLLCDGVLRGSFRQSLAAPVPIVQGEPSLFRVALGSIACRIEKGHRLRLDLANSNYPKFDYVGHHGDDFTSKSVSVQTVLHSPKYPSMLRFYTVGTERSVSLKSR